MSSGLYTHPPPAPLFLAPAQVQPQHISTIVQAVVTMQPLPKLTSMSAVSVRKFTRGVNTWRTKNANVQGGHTTPATVLSDLPAQMEACVEAQQIMEGIASQYINDSGTSVVSEEQFQTAMQNFIKAIDQRCQHTTTQEWNRIAMTGDMTPSELAAKITAMTEAVKHHHPVDQTTLMRKFLHAIPAHHIAVHKKIERSTLCRKWRARLITFTRRWCRIARIKKPWQLSTRSRRHAST